jgi:nucleotide-binding universal stress UspA family protein
VGVVDVQEDEAALRLAEDLAVGASGHVTATLVTPFPMALYSIDQTYTLSADLIGQARENGEADLARLNDRLARFAVPTETRYLFEDPVLAEHDVAIGARHADMAIFTRPWDMGDVRRSLIVGALFGAGRPVLVTPPDWKRGAIFDNVLIAWNASKEAARAVADAAPFISAAKSVRIVTVGAKPTPSAHGALPGADLATHLGRRGVTVEVVNLPETSEEDGELIAREAKRLGCDLLVMGGYGHSRAREMVFGGATRFLLTHAEMPILLSH